MYLHLNCLLYNFLPIKALSHQSDVLTAFPQRPHSADRRGARCAVTNNAVYAVCACCIVAEKVTRRRSYESCTKKMLSLKFAQCAVGTLCQRCWVLHSAVSAPSAHCENAG